MKILILILSISSAIACICTEQYQPVCGENGKTYSNNCFAECEEIKVSHEGDCKEVKPCSCPKMLEPVCGSNGTTYDNECWAKCAYIQSTTPGPCKIGPINSDLITN